MISILQKQTAQAIVNIFETGKALGDYGSVTLLVGDTGHLTYGRSQATLGSGSLLQLLHAYGAAAGPNQARALSPFMGRLERMDLTLDKDMEFHGLLRMLGNDPVMHTAQDTFFERAYWIPATNHAKAAGITSALGHCVIYDSVIHGSYHLIRDRTNAKLDKNTSGSWDEMVWVTTYIATRREWLATNANSALHSTVYRMDALEALAKSKNSDLSLPLVVRGVSMTEDMLTGKASMEAAAKAPGRVLRLAVPLMTGEDVKALQLALVQSGASIIADGAFGKATEVALRVFQTNHGLAPDGIAGPATRSALNI